MWKSTWGSSTKLEIQVYFLYIILWPNNLVLCFCFHSKVLTIDIMQISSLKILMQSFMVLLQPYEFLFSWQEIVKPV